MTAPATALKAASEAAPPPKSDDFPSGIPYIVGNEGAERFSFYGMKAILYVYLVALLTKFVPEAMVPVAQLAHSKAEATQMVHLFVAGVYAFPLIGAILSDRLLGKYNVIFWVSILYCVGHGILAVAGRLGSSGHPEKALTAMGVGLFCIALGSGGIKPCVSANVGDQFTKETGHLVTKVFQVFYFIINYGSFFSTILIPILYDEVGPELAFGVPGILMAVATIVFWLGRKKFIRVPPQSSLKLGLLDSLVTTLFFAPLFGTILGYFVMFERYQAAAGDQASVLGFFAASWWLPVACIAAVVAGILLFVVRQRIQPDRTSFLPVLIYALRSKRKQGETLFDPARRELGAEAGDGPPAVLRVIVVFSMVMVFWSLFDQHASTWVEQAKHMNLVLPVSAAVGAWAVAATLSLSIYAGIWLFCWIANRPLAGRTRLIVAAGAAALTVTIGLVAGACVPPSDSIQMTASQLSALNPLMVMMIIPGINVLVYAPLKKRGIEVKPLQKMTVGMILAGFAFASAAILQKIIETAGDGQVHALWQAVQYFIMTTAEVLVSITGLEFAYTQAPRAMKSTIMSFWLLFIAFGNLLVAFLAPLEKSLPLSQFFWVFAGLMIAAALVFAVLAYFYKGKTYLQQAASH
ncbi:MAG: hypothetical protein HYZ28_16460 [Myxococcales bacterium]|nr:hypothetical protein [Myxococcales bacterium]